MRRYLYILLAFGLCSISCTDRVGDGTEDEGDDYAKICTNLTGGDFENFGDFYKTGAANWFLELFTEDYSEIVRLEIQTPIAATSFVGTYPINGSCKAGSAVEGFINNGTPCGCCWVRYGSDYKVAEYLLCSSGEITISKSGGKYEILLDGFTADNQKFGIVYEGALEELSSVTARGAAQRMAIRVNRKLCIESSRRKL